MFVFLVRVQTCLLLVDGNNTIQQEQILRFLKEPWLEVLMHGIATMILEVIGVKMMLALIIMLDSNLSSQDLSL
jgi:hypothetical protein